MALRARKFYSRQLHATWNALIKRGDQDALLMATIGIATSAALISLCLLPFVPAPAFASWPFLAASTLPQIAYYILIAKISGTSDLGLAYPVMRGTGAAVRDRRECNSVWRNPIAAGIAGSGLHLRRRVADRGRAIPAFGCRRDCSDGHWNSAGHHVLHGARRNRCAAVGSAGRLYAVDLLLTGLPMAGWGMLRHRAQLLQSVRARPWIPLGGGGASLLSYGIAVWAMTRAPVAAVALRETSILFAALISVILLREKLTWNRIAAAVLLTAGAVAIRLS